MAHRLGLALMGMVVGIGATGCVGQCIAESTGGAIAPQPLARLFDGGMGAPCTSADDCSAGLACKEAYSFSDSYVDPAAQMACTLDCSNAPCPQGFACSDGFTVLTNDAGQPRLERICLPSCSADSDCQKGLRAGTCFGLALDGGAGDAGTADAGIQEGVCRPVECGGIDSRGTTCPGPYVCQAQEVYYGEQQSCAPCGPFGCYGGAPRSNDAARAAPRASWCGRL